MPNFFSSLFGGTPEKRENVSTLRPEQEPLYRQAVNAGLGRGAGGAIGDASDYYRNLLSDNSADYNSFAAPAMRQYNQDIAPQIAEQYAGMGAGGLSSSGFRNAQNQGSVDLAERLGAIRANLRQSGAQGLQNAGQIGLQNFSQNMVTQPGSEGMASSLIPAVLGGIGTAVGGPVLGAIGGAAGGAVSNWFNGKGNKVGAQSGAYGAGGPKASPNIGGGFRLPNFLEGQGRGY